MGTLPLFNEEKERYERLAKKLEIDIEFVHENVMMDEETGIVFSANWGLKGDPCPFLNNDNKCIIYEERALICKSFPIEKINIDGSYLNLGNFMHCDNFNHQEAIDSKKKSIDIYGEECVSSREEIQRRQKNISEKINALITLGKIKLKKVEKFYSLDILSIETFIENIVL
jgi:Fe-S-cluster containining protein